ncbi:hypothetical protein HDZ31DRAFT_35898 [Schizophyllum fasciatum]
MPGGAHDLAAELAFNPFSDTPYEVLHSPHARQPSSSSLSASDGGSSLRSQKDEEAQHRRSATDGPALVASASHPLHTADLSNENVTRPTLGKALSDLEPDDRVATTSQLNDEVNANEKLVLVHEVQPKDSLASVSIKYGIAMTDLRRANSMWTNDTIHLRKVLYIPIDKASRIPQLAVATPKDAPSRSNPEVHITPANESGLGGAGQATLRRVPASRLSYFPPQSPSFISPRTSLDSSFPAPFHKHARSSTAPASSSSSPPTISSLLNAFPIRLSFESTTSASTTDSEEHVELADVRRPRRRKSSSTFTHDHPRKVGGASGQSDGRSLSGDAEPRPTPTSNIQGSSLGRRVRTSQMEPVPGMTVPTSASRIRGSARGANIAKGRSMPIADGHYPNKTRKSLWDVFTADGPDATRNGDHQNSETDLEDVL